MQQAVCLLGGDNRIFGLQAKRAGGGCSIFCSTLRSRKQKSELKNSFVLKVLQQFKVLATVYNWAVRFKTFQNDKKRKKNFDFFFNAIFFAVLFLRNRKLKSKFGNFLEKKIQAPPGSFFYLKEHLLERLFWNFKKNLIMGTFLSTLKVVFYKRLINLKFQNNDNFFTKNFFGWEFSVNPLTTAKKNFFF